VAGTALEAESSVPAAALASERDGAASSPCLALLAGVEAGAQ
jgi:hypothetical protein